MKPLVGGNDCQYVIGIRHKMLIAYHIRPERILDPETHLLFMPKN